MIFPGNGQTVLTGSRAVSELISKFCGPSRPKNQKKLNIFSEEFLKDT